MLSIGLILFKKLCKDSQYDCIGKLRKWVEMTVLVECSFHSGTEVVFRHWKTLILNAAHHKQINRIKVRFWGHALFSCHRSRLHAICFQGHKTSFELCLTTGGFTPMHFSWQQCRSDVVIDFFKDVLFFPNLVAGKFHLFLKLLPPWYCLMGPPSKY